MRATREMFPAPPIVGDGYDELREGLRKSGMCAKAAPIMFGLMRSLRANGVTVPDTLTVESFHMPEIAVQERAMIVPLDTHGGHGYAVGKPILVLEVVDDPFARALDFDGKRGGVIFCKAGHIRPAEPREITMWLDHNAGKTFRQTSEVRFSVPKRGAEIVAGSERTPRRIATTPTPAVPSATAPTPATPEEPDEEEPDEDDDGPPPESDDEPEPEGENGEEYEVEEDP